MATISSSAPALISWDASLVTCRRVVLWQTCVGHHITLRQLAVSLVDSWLLLVKAAWTWPTGASDSRVLVRDHHYSWALIAEKTAIVVQIRIAVMAQVAVPVLVLFWATQLLVLLVHLHDLHYWLLHLDVFADGEIAGVSLAARTWLMIWDPQRLRLVLPLLNVIIVKCGHVILVLLVNLIVILLVCWGELIHVEMSPVQKGIWMGARRLLIAQISADLFARTMLLLLSQLIL